MEQLPGIKIWREQPPTIKRILLGTIATSSIVLLSALPSEAFTFTLGRASQSSRRVPTGASATVRFKLSEAGRSGTRLDVFSTNTTGRGNRFGAGATNSRLTRVAFDLPNNVSVAKEANLSGGLNRFRRNTTFRPLPGRGGRFEVDFIDRNSNPRNRLFPGVRGARSRIFLSSPDNARNLYKRLRRDFSQGDLRLAASFQNVNAGGRSENLVGGIVRKFDPPQQTPEPGTIAGMGMMAAFVAKFARKQQRRQSE